MPIPPDDEILPASVIVMLAPVVEILSPVNAPVTVIEDDGSISTKIVSVATLSVAAMFSPVAVLLEMVAPES